MNGYRIQVSAEAGETFLIGKVIGEKAGLPEITGWMEKHMRKAGA